MFAETYCLECLWLVRHHQDQYVNIQLEHKVVEVVDSKEKRPMREKPEPGRYRERKPRVLGDFVLTETPTPFPIVPMHENGVEYV